MVIPVYLWLKDDAGNLVKGSVDVRGREGSIEIIELLHGVELLRITLRERSSRKLS